MCASCTRLPRTPGAVSIRDAAAVWPGPGPTTVTCGRSRVPSRNPTPARLSAVARGTSGGSRRGGTRRRPTTGGRVAPDDPTGARIPWITSRQASCSGHCEFTAYARTFVSTPITARPGTGDVLGVVQGVVQRIAVGDVDEVGTHRIRREIVTGAGGTPSASIRSIASSTTLDMLTPRSFARSRTRSTRASSSTKVVFMDVRYRRTIDTARPYLPRVGQPVSLPTTRGSR